MQRGFASGVSGRWKWRHCQPAYSAARNSSLRVRLRRWGRSVLRGVTETIPPRTRIFSGKDHPTGGWMAFRFSILASGSSGNAAFLESDGFGLLIDAGLGPRQLASRLAAVGASWA